MSKKLIFNFGCKTDNDLGITLKFNYAAKGLVSQSVTLRIMPHYDHSPEESEVI
jgi:hypothetical protein